VSIGRIKIHYGKAIPTVPAGFWFTFDERRYYGFNTLLEAIGGIRRAVATRFGIKIASGDLGVLKP
jgi:hypothetical protein